jgi:peptidoglycan/LPS O-acetylase OafA/YrhL
MHEESKFVLERNLYRPFGAFRFLLAALVLTSHSSGFLPDGIGDVGLGNVGVMLFFIVSGTVICEALDTFYRAAPIRFLINRGLKIFPAYWAALAIFYVVFCAVEPERIRLEAWPVIVNVSLLLSYLPKGNNLLIIEIAWAIIVEFQFYFAAAAIYAIAQKSRTPGTILYGVGLAALVFYIFVHATNGFGRFYGAFGFAPYFVFGGAIYYGFIRASRAARWLAAAAAILCIHAYAVYIARLVLPGFAWSDAASLPSALIVSIALFCVGFAMFLWLAGKSIPHGVERLDKRLGDITYATYLVHPAVIALMVAIRSQDSYGGIVTYIIVCTASLLLAIAIFQIVERPVMRVRNVFRGGRLYD